MYVCQSDHCLSFSWKVGQEKIEKQASRFNNEHADVQRAKSVVEENDKNGVKKSKSKGKAPIRVDVEGKVVDLLNLKLKYLDEELKREKGQY